MNLLYIYVHKTSQCIPFSHLASFSTLFFFNAGVSLPIHLFTRVPSPWGGSKKALDPLELEIQMVVSS